MDRGGECERRGTGGCLGQLCPARCAALGGVLSRFPVIALPTLTIPSRAGEFAALIGGIHRAAPLGDVLAVLVLVLAVSAGLAVWDLGVFIYHQFWGAS